MLSNLISSQINNIPIRKEYLGIGETAIKNTLKKMKEIINESSINYYVRRWAEKITVGANSDDLSIVKAVFDFLARYTEYRKDPYKMEMLKTPPVSLQLLELGEVPMGDCDCLTILSLSLIRSLGIQVALRATSYLPDKSFRKGHVYGLVKVKEKWIPFDLVAKQYGFGFGMPGYTKIIDLEV